VSPPLPRISGDDATRALERAGFHRVRQRGSHLKLRSSAGRVAIVPMHRELAAGTLRSIIRQSGMTVDEFVGLL
jgi:predicted RNA binding protein YcfA (HicA-like mRNA interferase family)